MKFIFDCSIALLFGANLKEVLEKKMNVTNMLQFVPTYYSPNFLHFFFELFGIYQNIYIYVNTINATLRILNNCV